MPDAHRAALAAFLEACSATAPQFRWTPPGNLHLTIRFLGSVDVDLAQRVAERVQALEPSGFDVALGEIGTFKRGHLARVVWLGVPSGAEALANLAAQVESQCAAAGMAGEERPYQAHLTLARSRERDGAGLPKMPALPLLRPWRATELILYSSHLGRSGATYESLRAIRLEGG